MSLLELKNVTKVYDMGEVKTHALRGVSFSVESGEFLSIMGPSGSGKSTLLHVLGFLDKQSEGQYIFEGQSSHEYSEEEAAQIRNARMGFVFQTFNLLKRTTVLDNVLLPLVYSGIPEAEWDTRAKEVIESVGMSHRLGHDPSELSGGEKQRVAIARALVNDPSVIFADEPTGNLDSTSGAQVMEVFSRLHDEGRTILLITHESHTARYANRIVHIKDGEVEREEEIQKSDNTTRFSK